MYHLLGDAAEGNTVQGELDALLKARQETARLRARLVVGPAGMGSQGSRDAEYYQRLGAARERLLRPGES